MSGDKESITCARLFLRPSHIHIDINLLLCKCSAHKLSILQTRRRENLNRHDLF